MVYFEVEREFVRGKMFRHEVESDGSQASDSYGVDDELGDDIFEMTIGFVVNTYDEQGIHLDTDFYEVDTSTATWQDNADEVLEQIKANYPAGEYQNNRW